MEAIKLVGLVTEDGLTCSNPELMKFLNQEVDVLVFPKIKTELKVGMPNIALGELAVTDEWKNTLRDFISSFDEDDIKAFNEAIDDCSQINPMSWI